MKHFTLLPNLPKITCLYLESLPSFQLLQQNAYTKPPLLSQMYLIYLSTLPLTQTHQNFLLCLLWQTSLIFGKAAQKYLLVLQAAIYQIPKATLRPREIFYSGTGKIDC